MRKSEFVLLPNPFQYAQPNFFETYHQKDLTTSKIQDVRKAVATEIPLSERECSPNK